MAHIKSSDIPGAVRARKGFKVQPGNHAGETLEQKWMRRWMDFCRSKCLRLWPCWCVIRQYQPEKSRKWRFDFAWPDKKIAVEVVGGLYVQGGHNRAERIRRDVEKLNTVVSEGWRVLHFPSLKNANDDCWDRYFVMLAEMLLS